MLKGTSDGYQQRTSDAPPVATVANAEALAEPRPRTRPPDQPPFPAGAGAPLTGHLSRRLNAKL